MAVSLTNLRDRTFRRLNDRAYAQTGTPTVIPATTGADESVNDAIRRLVRLLESAGYRPLESQARIDAAHDYTTQVVTLSGSPTGGTFRLTLANAYKDLAHNASAATIQAAMRLIDPFTANGLAVSGSAGGPWTFTWTDVEDRPNVPRMIGSARNLTGGSSPSVEIDATAAAGSVIQREFRYDHWCRKPDGTANYRSDRICETLVEDQYVPNRYLRGGDVAIRSIVDYLPESYSGFGDALNLYRKGDALGIHEVITDEMVLNLWYLPVVPKLVSATDTLKDLRLGMLDPYEDAMALYAAADILHDTGSPAAVGMMARAEMAMSAAVQEIVASMVQPEPLRSMVYA